MVGDDEPQLAAESTELHEPLAPEDLDGGHQGGRTGIFGGDAERASLAQLEERSFRFVRHSVRWYRWAA